MGWGVIIMSIDINQLFEMLSWNRDEQTQKKGVEEASNIKYLSVLIQPIEDKSIWENCAKVLAKKSDKDLELYLMYLFKWLQDANWPGFEIIYNRIKKMPALIIISAYSCSIRNAIKIDDDIWLDYLSGFIDDRDLRMLLPNEYRILMRDHNKNFWKKQELCKSD
jgi:hypothetical protein